MNNFEAKILRGEVNLQLGFIKPKGNEEKLYSGTETPLLQALAWKNNNLVSTWYKQNAPLMHAKNAGMISIEKVSFEEYSFHFVIFTGQTQELLRRAN